MVCSKVLILLKSCDGCKATASVRMGISMMMVRISRSTGQMRRYYKVRFLKGLLSSVSRQLHWKQRGGVLVAIRDGLGLSLSRMIRKIIVLRFLDTDHLLGWQRNFGCKCLRELMGQNKDMQYSYGTQWALLINRP